MKKILSLLTITLLSFLLVSCQDVKTNNNSINVLFYTGSSGTNVETYFDLEKNSLLLEPNAPTRIGYQFAGWYKDVKLTEKWDFLTDRIGESSLVLYGKWEEQFFSITYVFQDDDSIVLPNSFYTLDEFLANNPGATADPKEHPELLDHLFYYVGKNTLLPRPTRHGYTFHNYELYPEYGWPGAAPDAHLTSLTTYKVGDAGYKQIPSNLARDLVLYAHWDPVKISVSFNANYPDKTIIKDNHYGNITFTYGYDIVYNVPANKDLKKVVRLHPVIDFKSGSLTYEGLDYEFMGWNSKADGTGTWYGDGTIVNNPSELSVSNIVSRTTLYAQWAPKS